MDLHAILNKMIRRTSRDVALAGAMVGSVAAMQKLFPVMEGYSTLRVDFYGDAWTSWVCAPCKPHSGVWRDFQKWYHGRKQSDAYVMRMKDGEQMMKRSDIRFYRISYGEREVKQ